MSRVAGADAPLGAAQLLDEAALGRALVRLGHEICERHLEQTPVLIGIPTRGVPLALRLARIIEGFGNAAPAVGVVDLSNYRDDRPRPVAPGSAPLTDAADPELALDIEDRSVILIDDVVQTGRSLRAALDAVLHHGRPSRVEVLALVDRGQRELPLRAGYVGKNVPVAAHDRVQVRLREIDGVDGAWLVPSGTGSAS